jgi:hypothetical protein
VKPRLLATALILAASLHTFAVVPETQAPASPSTAAGADSAERIPAILPAALPGGRLPTAAPDRLMTAFVASTPLAGIQGASLPRRGTESSPPPAPTAIPTPDPDRSGCDPAYPDHRTCIPPGPPVDQGCAITSERNFTVLPPDPQRLDHDDDGIGCEPIR